jgi:hypothetical protein
MLSCKGRKFVLSLWLTTTLMDLCWRRRLILAFTYGAPYLKALQRQLSMSRLHWRGETPGLLFHLRLFVLADSAVVGCTRFWNLERWAWPLDHPRYGRAAPDACEIGYTWLTRSAIRTTVNTETKLLLLTHAFEVGKSFEFVSMLTCATSAPRKRSNVSELGARVYSGPIAWPLTIFRAIR